MVKELREGPEAILNSSHYVEFYDEETDCELCFEKGIATLVPLKLNKLSPGKALEKIYSSSKEILADNKFLVTLGGEHSISFPPVKAHLEKYPELSILQIDAHGDLRDSYQGSKHSHACVMARIFEITSKIVPVGIRAICKEESQFIKKNEIPVFFMRDLRRYSSEEEWQESIISKLSDHVYITFDIDGLDPSLVPSTGTPEPGGLFWDETMNLISKLGKKKRIVGFDVVELAPAENEYSSNFTTAKLVYKLLNLAFQNK